jgi:hypothetical protein
MPNTFTINVRKGSTITPIVDAGPDVIQRLPNNTISVMGSATDVDGTIVSYLWTQESGPAMTLLTPTLAILQVDSLTVGTYVFKLTATDNDGLIGDDQMTLIVDGANIAPVADAGTDGAISLPVSEYVLDGSGTDSDGTVVGYQWMVTSAPGPEEIIEFVPDNQTATATIKGLTTVGTYTLQLTVTDNDGDSHSNSMDVVVSAPANTAPVINSVGALTGSYSFEYVVIETPYIGYMVGSLDVAGSILPWGFAVTVSDVDAHDVSVEATLVRQFDMSIIWTQTVNVVGGNGSAVFSVTGVIELGKVKDPEEYVMTIIATDAGALTDTEVRTFSTFDSSDTTIPNGGIDVAPPDPKTINGCRSIWDIAFTVPEGETGDVTINVTDGNGSASGIIPISNASPGLYSFTVTLENSGSVGVASSMEINTVLSISGSGQMVVERPLSHSPNYDQPVCV